MEICISATADHLISGMTEPASADSRYPQDMDSFYTNVTVVGSTKVQVAIWLSEQERHTKVRQ